MPPFSATTPRTTVDDFFLSTLEKMDNQAHDPITPRHPIFKKMERGDIQGITSEEPGRGPVREVYTHTPDRGLDLSEGRKAGSRVITPHESNTKAYFEWYLRIDTLTQTEFDYLNTKTKVDWASWIDRKRRGINTAHRNKQVRVLWDGVTVDGKSVFGLKDVIRFTPAANPARGAVGTLNYNDILDDDGGNAWTNKAANFNANCLTYVSGGRTASFISNGTNSLSKLFSDCGYYTGEMDEMDAYPDLIACNEPFWRACHVVAEDKHIFRDSRAEQELGVEGFAYRGATIYEDRNTPNDPNNAAYGVAFLINTKMFDIVYANGIRNVWRPPHTHGVDTFISADKQTQMSIAYRSLNNFGVLYGVIPTVTAS